LNVTAAKTTSAAATVTSGWIQHVPTTLQVAYLAPSTDNRWLLRYSACGRYEGSSPSQSWLV